MKALIFFTLLVFALQSASQNKELTQILIQGATRPIDQEDLPSSISVVSAESVQGRGIQHTQDIIEQVPGLSAAGGSNRPRFFQIRGVGEEEQYLGAPNPSVGFYIDGVDLSGLGTVGSLFDIQQAEVLRGPQATRFGSSAIAGAIALTSVDPGYVPSGTVELTPGSDDLASGGVAVGGPLDASEGKVRVRFSAFHLSQNGFRKNIFLNRSDTNERDESLVRGKIVWTPSREFEVEALTFYALADNGYDAFTIDNSFTTQSDRPGRDYQGTAANLVKLTYQVAPDLKIKSTSSISNTSVQYSFDGDWGNNPFWGENAPYDYFERTDRSRNTIGSELRLESDLGSLDRIGWLVGGFVQRLHESSNTDQRSNDQRYSFLASDYTANTRALFSQLEIPLPSSFSFVLAGRYEQRAMDYLDSKEARLTPTNNMFGGNASLLYHLDPKSNLYFTAARGFKGGGFNSGPQVPEDRRVFEPESLWNFESGYKGRFFDNRVSLNAALFAMFRRDQQTKYSLQVDPSDPLAFIYITDNAASGTNVGLETDLTYRATESLQFLFSSALLGTEFTEYNAGGRDLKGRGQSYSPPWQYSATARYLLSAKIFLEGNFTGRGAFYFSDGNNQRSDPYNLVNAVIGYRHDSWSVRLWGRNILNERYSNRGFYFGVEPPDFPNRLYVQRGDPRLLGVTLSWEF